MERSGGGGRAQRGRRSRGAESPRSLCSGLFRAKWDFGIFENPIPVPKSHSIPYNHMHSHPRTIKCTILAPYSHHTRPYPRHNSAMSAPYSHHARPYGSGREALRRLGFGASALRRRPFGVLASALRRQEGGASAAGGRPFGGLGSVHVQFMFSSSSVHVQFIFSSSSVHLQSMFG